MSHSVRNRSSFRRGMALTLDQLEARELLSAVPFAVPNVVIKSRQAPAQMATAYGANATSYQGQGMTVAIVDAFDSPNALADANTFSTQFGLPILNGGGSNPTFTKVTPTGQAAPAYNAGWAVEIGLDVQWVHAIAPYANIVLVETQDNSGDSLFAAEVDGQPYQSGVFFAKNYPGVVAVTNSYGSGEFAGETAYNSEFDAANVAITVSTGDSGAPGQFPAAAPNVVAVGGTSLYTASLRGRYGFENGWSGSGGGPSAFEPIPTYQSSNGVNFVTRSTPDVSMDADPNTGALVYYSPPIAPAGFYAVGGTSLSSPMFAAVIALADQARAASSLPALNSKGLLNSLYGAYNSANYLTYFHDIVAGSNGFAAGPGYDLVTGIGSPKVPALINLLLGASPAAVVGGPLSGGSALTPGGAGSSSVVHPFVAAGPASGVPSVAPQLARTDSAPAARLAGTVLPVTATVSQDHHAFVSPMFVAAQATPVAVEAAPAGAPVPATAPTTVRQTGTGPGAILAAPVVDAVFAGDSAPVSSEGTPDFSAPLFGGDEVGSADLAMTAGMALALGGAWSGMDPSESSRKQLLASV